MSDSDIFEKYAELALEKGLISKEGGTKEKLEKNPRWDSQDISAIELLYGVKPDSPKEMEYKKNIVEIAHPNTAVVMTSHDKLHGLVENLNEQNNILINIVNKPVDGHLTGRKYASDEFVRSLVRIANDMDNKNAEELRVLADKCIEQMNKKGYAAIAVVAVIAILGGVYLQQHLDMPGGKLEETGKRLVGELNDFLGDHLIGTDYTEEFQVTIKKIIEKIQTLLSKYAEFSGSIDQLQKPKDLEEMKQFMEGSPVTGPDKDDFVKLYQEFNTIVAKANVLFDQIEKRFVDQSYKDMQVKNVGIGERINKMFGRAFTGDKYALVADDFKDVLRALVPFRQSLTSVLTILKEADQHAKQEYAQMQASYTANLAGKPAPGTQQTPGTQTSGNPFAGISLE